jgi:hypothetical protein
MTAAAFWGTFLLGGALVLGPGVLNPYAPFNGLSIIGLALLFGATLYAVMAGGEEDD